MGVATEKPIRIAHIVGKWVGGGVESVVMNYYRHINRSQIQFDFICDEDSTDIPYDEIKSLGGKIILVPPYQKVFKYHKALKSILKEGKYKIVHSHINTLSVFSLWAAKSAGVPVRIAHSHSTTNKQEKKRNVIKQVLKRFSKVFSTHYMACSEYAGRWLFGDKAYDEGKVVLLHNAIDLDKFAFNEDVRLKLRKELNIVEDTLVVGHVGRFMEQKNHSFLLDIFNEIHKKNDNSILILVGQGPLINDIKEKVTGLGLENSVMFLGQRHDVSDLYQVFDVFLLPSLYEGLPVVGVEAQASGLLCYLSNNMTNETKVLDSTVFVSLDDTASEWANSILKNYDYFERQDVSNKLADNHFDIKSESGVIVNYYIDKYNNIKKSNVAAVVVVYNSDFDVVYQNIKSYIKYVDKVIVVDNSDVDNDLCLLKKINDIAFIKMDGNCGLGCALNVGINFALNQNYKYALLMDQDSNFINNPIDIYEQNYENDVFIYAPSYLIDRKKMKNKKNKYLYWTMTSGSLLRLDYYKKIGIFNEDLFLDVVDYEYCLRGKRKNFKIKKCKDTVLKHNPGITKVKKVFFWKYKYGFMNSIRFYYQIRNLKYISREYKCFRAKVIILIKLLKVILLFDNKKVYYQNYLRAKKDFRIGKYGQYEL